MPTASDCSIASRKRSSRLVAASASRSEVISRRVQVRWLRSLVLASASTSARLCTTRSEPSGNTTRNSCWKLRPSFLAERNRLRTVSRSSGATTSRRPSSEAGAESPTPSKRRVSGVHSMRLAAKSQVRLPVSASDCIWSKAIRSPSMRAARSFSGVTSTPKERISCALPLLSNVALSRQRTQRMVPSANTTRCSATLTGFWRDNLRTLAIASLRSAGGIRSR